MDYVKFISLKLVRIILSCLGKYTKPRKGDNYGIRRLYDACYAL